MRSSNKRRAKLARRWQRVVAGAVCAGSFLAGQLLFGEGLPRPLPRAGGAARLVPTAIRPVGEAAPVVQRSALDRKLEPKLAPVVSGSSLPRPMRNGGAPARPPIAPQVEVASQPEPQLSPIVAASAAPRPRKADIVQPEQRPAPAADGPISPWMQDIRTTLAEMQATDAPRVAAAPVAPVPVAPVPAAPVPVAPAQLAPVVTSQQVERARVAEAKTVLPQATEVAKAAARPELLTPPQPAALAKDLPAPAPAKDLPQPIVNPTIVKQHQPAAPARVAEYQPQAPAKEAPASLAKHEPAAPPAPAKALPPLQRRQGVVQVSAAELPPVEAAPVLAAPIPAAEPVETESAPPWFAARPTATRVEEPAARGTQAKSGSERRDTLVSQPAPLQPQPLPPADAEAGNLPAGSPFEVIEESGAVTLRVGRSKLMRTKVDIYRTAVVDEAICEIVQFTPREISLIGRSTGTTHITFWFDDPAMAPLTYLITVEPDAAAVQAEEDKYKLLEDVINEMFPDSKIHLLIVADKLIVKGQAKDAEEATQVMSLITAQAGTRAGVGGGGAFGGASLAEGAAAPVLSNQATGNGNRTGYTVINMLRVPGVQQVALKVKIAELNRSAARGFGVDVRGAVDLTSSATGSKLFLNSMLNMAAGQGSTLMAQFDGDDMQVGIRYLQEHGVIRLLSEPTLVTMSGRPATFIAGGEFAVPTIVGSAGLNAVTTDFRAFGAIISFMPTVIDKDRIRLEVAPEFSQINSSLTVGGTPGLKVRAATTTVEMREGQTLAIAGLLEDNINGSNTGDLPFLARVFGRRSTSHNETELIILVTPELVQPLDAEEVPPLPGFDVTEPNNGQFFLHGDLEGNPTQDYRSTVWPRLKKRYGSGGPAMTSGPFGHGQ